jgi:hypothetical protein
LVQDSFQEITMRNPSIALRKCPAPHRGQGGHSAHSLPHKPHKSPSEEAEEDEEGLELPVNPDEGAPLAPDEEGQVKAPA